MKRRMSWLMAVVLVGGMGMLASAADKPEKPEKGAKQVTLKGDLQCGKCVLNEGRKCQNVLVTKNDEKVVQYFLVRNAVSKAFDARTCGGDKIPVTVTGLVVEKEGKNQLTAKKIEEDKS